MCYKNTGGKQYYWGGYVVYPYRLKPASVVVEGVFLLGYDESLAIKKNPGGSLMRISP